MSTREATRQSRSLLTSLGFGYVIQPDVRNLEVWLWGRTLDGVTRWNTKESGTEQWARDEVAKLQPLPAPVTIPKPPLTPHNSKDEMTEEEFRNEFLGHD